MFATIHTAEIKHCNLLMHRIKNLHHKIQMWVKSLKERDVHSQICLLSYLFARKLSDFTFSIEVFS